jgi:Zn-dependent protease with chaperone function
VSTVAATYFDGDTAKLRRVTITIDHGVVSVRGDGIDRQDPFTDLIVDDVLGDAPRVVRFRDGAVCEVRDGEGLRKLLAANGVHASSVSQWEGHLGWIAAGVAVFALIMLAGYWYGIPAAASAIATRVPDAATRQLSTQAFNALDGDVLAPSELTPARREALASAFDSLRFDTSPDIRLELHFRKSEWLGANAFALPSGAIVMTDELVRLAKDDRELLGVLAHEAGHVVHRHGLRTVLQNSLVGLALAWFIGDVSTIVSAAPTLLIETSYSRDLEREADAYAVQALRTNGISVEHYANILGRLGAGEGTSTPAALRYLSSHPPTEERLQRLRGQ